jgi:putative transposase
MARSGRIVIPGCPHHVVHRANRGGILFEAADHYRLYLRWLREYADELGLLVWAYCLMSNHVHLVGVPTREDSLARTIGQAHMRYSRWLSHSRGESGHVWANRFYSAPMDDAHLWEAVKYVELNPVRAGLVEAAESYPWSSAHAHVRAVPDAVLSGELPFGATPRGPEWAEWLRTGLPGTSLGALRHCTKTGTPLGSREFVAGAVGRLSERGQARPPTRGARRDNC